MVKSASGAFASLSFLCLSAGGSPRRFGFARDCAKLLRALAQQYENGRILGGSGRLARLALVVDRMFDIPTMTRLAISFS